MPKDPLTKEAQKLIEDNHRLIYAFLKKYRLPEDEYYDLAALAFCDAAKNYNIDSGYTFATFAFVAMEHAVMTEHIRLNRKRMIPKEHILYYQAPNPDVIGADYSFLLEAKDNVEEEIIYKMLIQEALSKFKDRRRTIAELFLLGYTTDEIAKKVKCSRQNVSLVTIKFRKILKEALK